jgi:hypothetical protein
VNRGARAVVWAGAAAGALDILAAFAFWATAGVAPSRVLQGVASGLLGREAFRGGAAAAALGLALHFVIAFGAAGVYYAARRWWPILVQRAVLAGLAYGIVVYVVMNRVVLPLSRVSSRTQPWSFVLTMVAIHMVFVGLPIALAVRRFTGEPDRAGT